MKILSIDWDYFFPDPSNYDWGLNEGSTEIMKSVYDHIIWSHRWNNIKVFGKNKGSHKALDYYKPDLEKLKDFWEKIIIGEPKRIIIADSHLELYYIINDLSSMGADIKEVVNIDAHHDYGYEQLLEVDCGNWAYFITDIVEDYYLYYPEWRIQREEECINSLEGIIYYGLPKPDNYDLIFLCRSSGWTPPWSDNVFLYFIKKLRKYKAWDNVAIDYRLLEPRPFIQYDISDLLKDIKKYKEKIEKENGEE